jgi:hypothetical protein
MPTRLGSGSDDNSTATSGHKRVSAANHAIDRRTVEAGAADILAWL